jgi:hypothetical protein
MRLLSASDLLDIWERGAGGTPVEQALVILATVFPQAPRDVLAGLNIARRDAALFHLRELTFGPQLKGLSDCPACRERLELAFSADDLRSANILPAGELPPPGSEPADLHSAPVSFQLKGYRVSFRLPTSADLLDIAALAHTGRARQQLLRACLLSVARRKDQLSVDELPPEMEDAIIERIGQSAALANLTIAATCPACGHQWEVVFDIVSYFWSEINAWAVRMMHEIHALASAYGWREADILAMSAWRRQRYLEMIGA